MTKILIAFYFRHGQNYVDGSIRQIMLTVPDANLTAGVAIHGATASHCDRKVKLILEQAK